MTAARSNRPQYPAPARGYASGQVVAAKYELIRQLGAGGMGVVWVAHDRVLDVHVAMKIIDLDRSPHPKRIAERVLQEARAAARLAHPAICRVFEFGETEAADPFIVSELLHGDTLGDVLNEQLKLPPTRSVQLLLPIVEGLVLAHSRGVVHRDVKPENIFLSRDEVSRLQPKLLDFGIARMVDTESKITIDGTLLGTPDYMSPEQARGEHDIDHRTDVWSISVVLYELVTGRRPFDGDNYNALLWQIAQEEAPPITELGVADGALWKILARGLMKDRDDRWPTMRDFGTALVEWLLGQGVTEDVCGFALRATWLQSDGRVALSQAPTPIASSGDGQVIVAADVISEERAVARPEVRQQPNTGVFERQTPRVRPVLIGLGLVGSVAIVAGLLLVGRMGSPELVVEEPTAAPAPSVPPPIAVVSASSQPIVASSGTVVEVPPTTPSASASAAVGRPPIAPMRRRPRGRKLDPNTYDFGF